MTSPANAADPGRAAPAPGSVSPGSSPPEPAAPAPATDAARDPLLPEQSREDTDAAWGDYPERADDRLYRDRPPHWDDF